MNGRVAALFKEPNLIVSIVTTGLGLAVLFGVKVSDAQTAGILLFLGAVLAAVRFLVTWRPDVVARLDAAGQPVAGPAAQQRTGSPVLTSEAGPHGNTTMVVPIAEPPGQHRREV